MFRNAIVLAALITVLTGPFVAIAATTVAASFENRNGKPICCFFGIACSKGPTILPALSRLK